MDVKEQALAIYKEHQGVLGTNTRFNVDNLADLGKVYTPGVGAICKAIEADPARAYELTMKGRSVLVVTNGTAILGFGDIGPLAGFPIVEAKSFLHKEMANIDAFPVTINETDPDKIIDIIKSISLGFGAIHLEDIKAPECFYIENRLIEELDIPVCHDDQHGTSVAVLTALYNSLKLTNRTIEDAKIVITGAGAGGLASCKLLLAAGAKHITLVDINGAIVEGDPTLNPYQAELAKVTNLEKETGSLADVIKGKDVFIGLSAPQILTTEMVSTMNKDSIVFALANPVPEIYPEDAKKGGAKIVATGRGDFPNQINNLLVFPGIFKGALQGRITNFTNEMRIAAAKKLAALVEDGLNVDMVLPTVFNRNAVDIVANCILEFAGK